MIMILRLLCLILLTVLACSPQAAPAQILSDTDAKAVADSWRQLQESQEAWSKLKASLRTRYRLDWADVEFSNDFRVMVPKTPDPPKVTWWTPTYTVPNAFAKAPTDNRIVK